MLETRGDFLRLHFYFTIVPVLVWGMGVVWKAGGDNAVTFYSHRGVFLLGGFSPLSTINTIIQYMSFPLYHFIFLFLSCKVYLIPRRRLGCLVSPSCVLLLGCIQEGFQCSHAALRISDSKGHKLLPHLPLQNLYLICTQHQQPFIFHLSRLYWMPSL